ncbi:acyltransferase family protein [uncultured Maricaulis sp.]|uniref:acyltransferase family protein n=1 Tax=uncultured Maricaulis sp. TaxID=174710 RepID=UPI002639B96B|nr:acyltransferase family protein [uncultured Maricaulis sp.]
MSSTKSHYIAPLDGLRAVAVVGVLVFHLNYMALPGGFVGVDVFFVISGYIISRIIFQSSEVGRFSFFEFYTRRLARLFPALAVVVSISLLASIFIVGSSRLMDFSQTGLYAIISSSNIFFWLNSGYFEDTSQTNIFLHTWSLGVEEQFYLFWPILLSALFGLSDRSRVMIFAAIFILGALSSWIVLQNHPSAMFYLAPTRAFQFALGACVAAFHRLPNWQIWSAMPVFGSALTASGLIGIGTAFLFANGQQYNFAVAALLPTIGSFAVLLAVQSRLSLLVLGNAPMTYIGTRAYSLYLVHWPIIVLTRLLYGAQFSPTQYIVLFAAIFISAEFLYRFIETPLRFQAKEPADQKARKAAVAVGLCVASLVGAAHLWALNSRIHPEAAEDAASPEGSLVATPVTETSMRAEGQSESQQLQAVLERHGSIPRRINQLWAQWSQYDEAPGRCEISGRAPISELDWSVCLPETAPPAIVVLGDSVGREAYAATRALMPDVAVGMASQAGCMPIYPTPPSYEPRGCREFNQRRFGALSNPEVSTVVLTGNWGNSNFDEISSTAQYLLDQGKSVIIVGPRPVYSESPATLLESPRGAELAHELNDYLNYNFFELESELMSWAAASGREDVTVWAVSEVICPDGRCSAFSSEGELIYLDHVHLTLATARRMAASQYAPRIE